MCPSTLPNCYLPVLGRCHGYKPPLPPHGRLSRWVQGDERRGEVDLAAASASYSCQCSWKPPLPSATQHTHISTSSFFLSFSSSNLQTVRSPSTTTTTTTTTISPLVFRVCSCSAEYTLSLSTGPAGFLLRCWPKRTFTLQVRETERKRKTKVSKDRKDVCLRLKEKAVEVGEKESAEV